MELLQGDAFDLFRTFNHSAFHQELPDTCQTSDEIGPFGLFPTGKRDDFAWLRPWLVLVRDVTDAGKP